MPEVVVDFITSLDGYASAEGWPALRWLIENPVVLPVPGAKNGRQAAANTQALTFTLAP